MNYLRKAKFVKRIKRKVKKLRKDKILIEPIFEGVNLLLKQEQQFSKHKFNQNRRNKVC